MVRFHFVRELICAKIDVQSSFGRAARGYFLRNPLLRPLLKYHSRFLLNLPLKGE